MVAATPPGLGHKEQTRCPTTARSPCPEAESVSQTKQLIRLKLLKQPPLFKLASASLHIWHCHDFTEPPCTFLLRLCHWGTLPAFFLTGNDQNHVQIWPRTSKGQAQRDSAQENCFPRIKLLDKGAKAEFTFKRVRKIMVSPLRSKRLAEFLRMRVTT